MENAALVIGLLNAYCAIVTLLPPVFSEVAHLMRMSPVCTINAILNVFYHQLFCKCTANCNLLMKTILLDSKMNIIKSLGRLFGH